MAFIHQPKKLPRFIRFSKWVAERQTKKEMEILGVLSWYPEAISSSMLEAFITHKDKDITSRMLQLIRLQVSILIGCPFCIDMNKNNYEKNGITNEELDALQVEGDIPLLTSFSDKEVCALTYTRVITRTPIMNEEVAMERMKELFSEREIVIICTTISQVNDWARMMKGFGIPVACLIQK